MSKVAVLNILSLDISILQSIQGDMFLTCAEISTLQLLRPLKTLSIRGMKPFLIFSVTTLHKATMLYQGRHYVGNIHLTFSSILGFILTQFLITTNGNHT